MKKLIKILYTEKKFSLVRLFFITFILTLTVSLAVEIYNYGNKELENIADKTKISVAFSNMTTENYIYNQISILKKNPNIKSIEYISPEAAEKEFFDNYQAFSADILTANPFPPVINITVKKEYFEIKNIRELVKKIKKTDYVDKVRYKAEFIESFSLFRKHVFDYLSFFSILLLILFVATIFFTIKSEYQIYPAEMNRLLYLGKENKEGVGIFSCIVAINIFILLNIIISIFISDLIFVISWWLLKEKIFWLQLVNTKTLLFNSFVVGSVTLIISIISSVLLRRKLLL